MRVHDEGDDHRGPSPSYSPLFLCLSADADAVPVDGHRCEPLLTPALVIVKASSGPRYVVSYRPQLPVDKVSSMLALLGLAERLSMAGWLITPHARF